MIKRLLTSILAIAFLTTPSFAQQNNDGQKALQIIGGILQAIGGGGQQQQQPPFQQHQGGYYPQTPPNIQYDPQFPPPSQVDPQQIWNQRVWIEFRHDNRPVSRSGRAFRERLNVVPLQVPEYGTNRMARPQFNQSIPVSLKTYSDLCQMADKKQVIHREKVVSSGGWPSDGRAWGGKLPQDMIDELNILRRTGSSESYERQHRGSQITYPHIFYVVEHEKVRSGGVLPPFEPSPRLPIESPQVLIDDGLDGLSQMEKDTRNDLEKAGGKASDYIKKRLPKGLPW